MQSADEKLEVASLNLRAAQRAHAATAYVVAVDLCRTAAGILGPDGWDEHPELTYRVNLLLGRCLSVTGEAESAKATLEQVLARVANRRDRVDTLTALMEMHMGQSAASGGPAHPAPGAGIVRHSLVR